MRILRTKLSMSRVTNQFEEAQKLGIDTEGVDKYEFKFEPFNLLIDKVSGYMPDKDRTKVTGEPCTAVFIDSDYIIIGMSVEKFEKALTGRGLSVKQISSADDIS